jgi:hypothetical protein
MLPFEDRYTRQRRLEEVGPEGQRQLEQRPMVLARHADSDLELEYLERAGVQCITFDAAALAPRFPWAEQFQFAGPLAVARGAYAALARIRAALACDPELCDPELRDPELRDPELRDPDCGI